MVRQGFRETARAQGRKGSETSSGDPPYRGAGPGGLGGLGPHRECSAGGFGGGSATPQRECSAQAKNGKNTIVTTLSIFTRTCIAGPARSLRGSPTVSPT